MRRCVEYLLRAFVIGGKEAVVVGQTLTSDGELQPADIPCDILDSATFNLFTTASEFALTERSHDREKADLGSLTPLSVEGLPLLRSLLQSRHA